VSEEQSTRRVRKHLIRVAKWAIALVVAAGLIYAADSAVDQWNSESEKLRAKISELEQQIGEQADESRRTQLAREKSQLESSIPTVRNLNWAWIALASLTYALALLPPGFVLAAAVRSLGERASLQTAMASQLLGHAGKYVPGKAMVIVLRVGGLSTEGISGVTATISVFMETLLMMAVGAAVACVVILGLPVPSWMMATAAVVAVAASIPTLPPILKRVAAKVAHRNPTGKLPTQATSSVRFFVVGWSWSLLSWLLIGTSFTMLVSAIPSPIPLPTPVFLVAVCTAAISLAMVVGFASLLPGGAGVRELVLTTILALAIGTAHALLAAVAARLMFIAVEALSAGLAWIWLRRRAAVSPTAPTSLPELSDPESMNEAEPVLQPE
jgi:uncharacterized membrane protein YbhN (UPF0104 family)